MPDARDRRNTLVAAALLVAAVLAVHGRDATFDWTLWDDDLYVSRNPAVASPGTAGWRDWLLTPSLGYPIPVTVASLAAERAAFGPGPASHHVVNVLLHVAGTLLLYGCALRLGSRAAPSPALPWMAAAAAALFALHPAASEAVAWVPGRKDLLATVFALGALLLFLRLPPGDRRWTPRVAAASLLVLAMLSKPVAGLLPLLFLGMDRRGRPAAWFAALAVDLVLVGMSFHLEAQVGALENPGGPDALARVLAGAWRHGRILLFPFDNSPKYLDDPAGIPAVELAAGAAMLAVSGAALAVALWRRSPAAVGIGLAALTYGPVSGLVPLTRQYADSYVHLPLAGAALALVAVGAPALGRASRRLLPALAGGTVAVLAALAVTAFGQAGVYADAVSLWTEVYRRYPDSPQVCRNLGTAWMTGRRNEPATAARVYTHCIATLGNRDFFLKNLAIATWLGGDRGGAAALFDEYRAKNPGDRSVDKYR